MAQANTAIIRAMRGDQARRNTGDAVPNMVSPPNAGMPQMIGTILYPKVIKALTQVFNSIAIGGEEQFGDWVDHTVMMPFGQYTGEAAPYGDYAEGGNAGANFGWISRGIYVSQTQTRYGQREAAQYAKGNINYPAQLEEANAQVVARWHNKVATYGIVNAGGPIRGYLNNPGNPASISPLPNGSGGSTLAQNQEPQQQFAQFQNLYRQLIVQTKGNASLNGAIDENTAMTFVLPNYLAPWLLNMNQYMKGNFFDLVKQTFPNVKFVQVPEYETGGVTTCQLYINSIYGDWNQKYMFPVKMMSFPVFFKGSYQEQKHAMATMGAVVRFPQAVATLVGW